MRGKQPAFWLAIVGVSILSQPLFNLVADSKAGDVFPALRTLNYASTRKNG